MSRQTFARIVLAMLGTSSIIALAFFAPVMLGALGIIIGIIVVVLVLLWLIITAFDP